MGLLRKLWNFGRKPQTKSVDEAMSERGWRLCRFETMEPRQLMAADLHLGAVYYEEATTDDAAPDVIEVTFEGGAAGTQLTRVVIDGDKLGDGLTSGDIFFDTAAGGRGVFGFAPLQVIGHDGFEVTGVTISDGGSLVTFDLVGFNAGEKLIFSVDVDEATFVDTDGTADETAIAEGAEFQRSKLSGTFQAQHYEDITLATKFWDAYDDDFADAAAVTGHTLDLPSDKYVTDDSGDERVRTAGGVAHDKQKLIPAMISGYVYHDRDNDGVRDVGVDEGIAGVRVDVIAVSTLDGSLGTFTTETDANGFWKVANLVPGTYRVVEAVQPAGYIDGKDTPGKIDGVTVGSAVTPDGDELKDIFLGGGKNGIEYNFGEIRPGSISGRVHADPEADCVFGPNDIALEGVQIDLLDANGNFITKTFTDANGRYKFEGLAPGTYSVFEHQPAGYFDFHDEAGSAGGTPDDVDSITGITLTAGLNAVDYNFCEILPSSIRGRVHADPENDCEFGEHDIPLAGVQIDLLDKHGNFIKKTFTDANGFYAFENLGPGEYQVFEHQPAGYFDGMDEAGSVGGVVDGVDTIKEIVLVSNTHAVNYDFCEILPSSIRGRVHADPENDCEFGEHDIPLAGVQIDLLDKHGNFIKKTFTDANGFYAFENLGPGEYQVFEHQPAGYFDGMDEAGSVGGVVDGVDTIKAIKLTSGTNAVEYDFCEILPSSIRGRVHADPENDCEFGEHDVPLGGVRIDLLDKHGNFIKQTFTDANGFYEFKDLAPGEYQVFEHQPAGYLDGMDSAGSVGGQVDGVDTIKGIKLASGTSAVNYDFCEIQPASIRGRVFADLDDDCLLDKGEKPLAGVKIELLNHKGKVVGTTRTDANGEYVFSNLTPGTYSVRETQPVEYFNGGQVIGSGGGIDIAQDLMGQIDIHPGAALVEYNFCEVPPGKIAGFVYQDGQAIATENGQPPEDIEAVRNGIRSSDDKPLAGVTLELRHGDTGEPILGGELLGGIYGTGRVRVTTDERGYYEFVGLPAGTYAVYQVQPDEYIDGVDHEGSLGGIPINPKNTNPALEFLILQLGENDPNNDAIIRIPLAVGASSVENNFSEVLVLKETIVLPPPPTPEPVLVPAVLASPPVFVNPLPLFPSPLSPRLLPEGSGEVNGHTWHLSVIDAGYPRALDTSEVLVRMTGTQFDVVSWRGTDLTRSGWTLRTPDGEIDARPTFGNPSAIPVTGDFNGDGVSDIGVFIKGEWYIDINGNGLWDEGDLWAKLGHDGDLPATGDWDGDGKTDIGIFGPAWPRDPIAIERDPGLPDPYNLRMGKWKNVPPTVEDATLGERMMKLTSRGKVRADLIDHVFNFGVAGDRPITGDWNGDGIDTIGVFRNGQWNIDTDGDGRATDADDAVQFGESGDLPVIGDWDGDGVDQIGVYRNGRWILDTNNNHQFDAEDRAFELGEAGDVPVVGDWNGDGVDEPAVYHPEAPQRQAKK